MIATAFPDDYRPLNFDHARDAELLALEDNRPLDNILDDCFEREDDEDDDLDDIDWRVLQALGLAQNAAFDSYSEEEIRRMIEEELGI